jgi:PAS domain S-box-containing protein
MKFEEHVERTKKLFGVSGRDIHQWIDSYYDRKRVEKLSASNVVAFNPYDHRRHRHHRQALEEALREFEDRYPPEVVQAVFEQHIKDDYEGYIPDKSDFTDPDFLDRYHKRFPKIDTGQKERLKQRLHRRDRFQFFWRFVLPSLLVLIIVAVAISVVAIPFFRSHLMEQKKQTISELTLESWQILDYWHNRAVSGELTQEQARNRAIEQLRSMRYGEDLKDYFWVTNLEPVMVMHPYLPDLEGRDLSNYRDPEGKLLFVESVETVKSGGSGYVDYRWQWQDDPDRVVPKLSHVRLFEPWDWIVGTGVYIDDVEQETRAVTRLIIVVSIGLMVVVAGIMLFLASQSYALEQKRRKAEDEVVESRLRYKALVESSGEGLIMVLEGRQVYFNQVILDMLGYTREEFGILKLHEFLYTIGGRELSGVERFKELMTGSHALRNVEAALKKKNGDLLRVMVSISSIEIGKKTGFLMTVRDISEHHEVRLRLDMSEDRVRILTENIGIGVFRLNLEGLLRVEEPNSACLDILGFRSVEELNDYGFLSLFTSEDEKQRLLKSLRRGEFVKNRLVSLRRNDGAARAVTLTMLPSKGENRWYDAIMEDMTTRRTQDQQRHELLDEIQSAIHSMNQPIGDVATETASVTMHTSIHESAVRMSRSRSKALLVTSETGELIGIVTDTDLRERVLAAGLGMDEPVYKIMSSPVVSIADSANVFEAAMLMQKKNIHHLPVLKNGDAYVFSTEELLRLQRNSHLFFLQQIEEAEDREELGRHLEEYRRMVRAMVPGGASAVTVSRFLSGGADAVARKLIGFVLDEMGDPPRPFCFILMGSWGRQEPTFLTDQDNAIIWGDGEDTARAEINAWFLDFGKKVCTLLDQFGYPFCKGGTMSKNPKWVKPLSEWKSMFRSWMQSPEPEEILSVQVFFDFRSVYGDAGLADELRRVVMHEAPDRPVFLWNLAQGCISYKVRSATEGDTFDVKQALRPVVNYARLQALSHGVWETGTLARLHRLYDKEVLNASRHRSTSQIYEYLSQMRLRHQYRKIENGYEPDNLIVLDELSGIDRDTLHRLLDQINSLQNVVKREYRDLL